MTDKQQQILHCALELFSTEGYKGTSTSKIANKAGVSEGLIFRHFKNKDGLLQAIIDNGNERMATYVSPIIAESDDKKRIEKAIRMPFNVPKRDYAYWKLIYSLKWQKGFYKKESMELLLASLEDSFRNLGYENPHAEAEIIEITLDGIATVILLKGMEEPEIILTQLLKKYNL